VKTTRRGGGPRAWDLLSALTTVLTTALAAPSWAAGAHEHGVARLDIGVEPQRVSLGLTMPLEALVGFERVPRSDAERNAVAAALATMRDAGRVFRIDAKAGCEPAGVTLSSEALGLGLGSPAGGGATGTSTAAANPTAAKAARTTQDDHADLDAGYEFRCRAGAQAGFVEIGLFEAFPRLKRIELQIATPRGQMKATLQRPNARVALVR
jgi:hypothetical protein